MPQFKSTIEQFEDFLRDRIEDANATINRLSGTVDFLDLFCEQTIECDSAFARLNIARAALVALKDFQIKQRSGTSE